MCQTGNAEETDAKTREFLRAVVEILLDHITVQNDRTTKILDFHSPDQLKEVIDFAIPDEPLNLDQLLVDCKDTLKYQVKTGMCEHLIILVCKTKLCILLATSEKFPSAPFS